MEAGTNGKCGKGDVATWRSALGALMGSPRLSPVPASFVGLFFSLGEQKRDRSPEREREKERTKRRSLMQMTLTAGKEVIRQLIERRRRVARQSVVPFDARPGARRYPSLGGY